MKQTCRSWHNKWLAKIIWKAICAQILCFAEIVFIFEEGINPFQIFLECCVVCINFSKILLQELLNETKSKRGAAVFNYFINLAKLKPNCVTQTWRQFYHEHLFSKGRLTQFLWKRMAGFKDIVEWHCFCFVGSVWSKVTSELVINVIWSEVGEKWWHLRLTQRKRRRHVCVSAGFWYL